VVRQLLEARGHSVLGVYDPQEALKAWEARRSEIDLIVCDVAMPGMRGPELVQRMLGDDRAQPVLFITGYSEEAVGENLGHPVLTKPFSPKGLEQAVRKALGLD